MMAGISRLKAKIRKADRRLVVGMGCYAALIVAALIALLPARNSDEWFILIVVLLAFTLLIIKTVAHAEAEGEADERALDRDGGAKDEDRE
ncbi:MAG TPA: hypothetical protein VLL97_01830 [Acidobacteriota bacterium]|nr:hypothetical protein [Acidobacteriota bacterium]